MRALIESVLTHLLLRGDAVRKREDFIELSASLPFYTDPSTVMGIVVKGYCDAVHYMGSEGNSGEQMKQDVIDAMQQAFGSGIRDVKAEVVRSFRFWDCVRFFLLYLRVAIFCAQYLAPRAPQVCAAVKVLRDEKAIDAEVARQFEAADAWLKPYSPPGGTS